MKKLTILCVVSIILCFSCKDDPKPKPKGFLALEYPEAKYKRLDIGCPYTFDKNTIAEVSPSKNKIPCWIQLDYQEMNGHEPDKQKLLGRSLLSKYSKLQ